MKKQHQLQNFHPRNKFSSNYNMDKLCEKNPDLFQYVFENVHGAKTIDFSDTKAVKALNKSLLFAEYYLDYWEFPDENLCPPIPGRADYIHHLYDLLEETNIIKYGNILDIGTGASCIYPLLGNALYNWEFVGTDIDEKSLFYAQKNIDVNGLSSVIKLRFQSEEKYILQNIMQENDFFDAVMCNPPFYTSYEDAKKANERKSKNLGVKSQRNFSGKKNELWYKGGEKAFLHTYLYESSIYKEHSYWFTSLVSKKENLDSLQASAKKLKATEFEIIKMKQGNKITRIVAWSFFEGIKKGKH